MTYPTRVSPSRVTAPESRGFSHRDLTTAQLSGSPWNHRTESPFFTDVEMVALLTENAEGADDFIQRTLGNLESASPALKTTY